jgi:hypothetical protein
MPRHKSKSNAKKDTRNSDAERDHLTRWSEYLGVTEEELRAAMQELLHWH